MLLAVLSDTHGRVAEAVAALTILNARDPGAFLHCGDVGDRRHGPGPVLDALADAAGGRPAFVVPGNADPDPAALRAACEDRGLTFGDPVVFTLNGVRTCGTHGTRREQQKYAAGGVGGGPVDVVCSGHTHRRSWEVREVGGRRVALLNPGACWRAAERTVAVLDLSDPAGPAAEFLTVPRAVP